MYELLITSGGRENDGAPGDDECAADLYFLVMWMIPYLLALLRYGVKAHAQLPIENP